MTIKSLFKNYAPEKGKGNCSVGGKGFVLSSNCIEIIEPWPLFYHNVKLRWDNFWHFIQAIEEYKRKFKVDSVGNKRLIELGYRMDVTAFNPLF